MSQKKQKINHRWRNFILNIGCALVRYGAVYKPGMIIKHPEGLSPNIKTGVPTPYPKGRTYWIRNMFFNFQQNKITYDLDSRKAK